MKKEEKYMRVLGVFSVMSFIMAIVAWFMTIECVQSDLELLYKVHKISCYTGVSDLHKIMEIVSLVWSASMWYKLWIISAVASTVLAWPCGGFLSLLMMTISFGLALGSSIIPLGTIHIDTWLFIVAMNIGVFILWCVVVFIKGIPEMKKEVSLQM